jgi:hypothetical protein
MSPFSLEHGAMRPGPAAPKRPTIWQGMSFPQKALAILFLPMVASVIVIFTDIVPTVMQKPPATTSTSAPSASAPTEVPTEAPTGDPEDIDRVPLVPPPMPSGLPPAVSASASAQEAVSAAPVVSNAPPPQPPAIPTEEPETSKNKSLQRQAVDAVHAGAYERAAELYGELAKKYPENKAYAAAAAIARAKAGGRK